MIAREIGDRCGEGNALNNLVNSYAAPGETRRAIELSKAPVIFEAIESPHAAGVRATIARLDIARLNNEGGA